MKPCPLRPSHTALLYDVLLAGLLGLFLGAGPARAQEGPVVTIEPAEPRAGDAVTITYHAQAPGAALREAEAVTWVPGPGSDLGAKPAAMKRDGTAWTHTFTVDSSASYGSFYFRAGSQEDANSRQHWDLFVHDGEGVPVEGAYLRRALTLRGRVDDPGQLRAMMAEAYRDELAAHPESFVARVRLYAHRLKQRGTGHAAIQAEAERTIREERARAVADPAALKRVEWAYNLLGKTEQAEEVRQQVMALDPDDSADVSSLFRRAMEETNETRKRLLLEQYIDEHPDSPFARPVREELLALYAKSGKAKKALELADALVGREEASKAQIRDHVARVLVEHDLALDRAEAYAEEALGFVDEEPVGRMRFSEGVWEEEPMDADVQAQRRTELEGRLLGTLGSVYLKQGRQAEAERTLKAAAEKAPRDLDVLYALANAYEQAEKPGEAYAVYWDLLREAPEEETAREGMRRTYVAVQGSEAGFDEALAEVEALAREAAIERLLAERLDRPAPDVAFAHLDGATVRLADLAGKVVVMDFWATWCGPCLMAFPHLQRVYERFEDHPDVRFLVVNTGQGDALEDVEAFMEENEGYTFPVFYDEGQAATDAFEVSGIPTTILLDKAGRIQFRHLGFSGEGFEGDLALQIETLLGERSGEADLDR